MYIEICNDAIRKTNTRQAIKGGYFTTWDADRIRRAFNNGHGTLQDFKRYRKDNSPKYCTIIEISDTDLNRLYQTY